MLDKAHEALTQRLSQWKDDHLYRQHSLVQAREGAYVICDGQRRLCFASNDYLGLAQHAKVTEAAKQAIDRYGMGSGSAAVVAGFYTPHRILEEKLATFFSTARALIFSSGYLANQAVVSSLLTKNDVMVADKLCHASVLEAVRCSGAKLWRYQHADVMSCARYLQRVQAQQHCLLTTEGVFGMDGDVAPLAALSQQRYSWLLIDDAHGVGVLGKRGRGSIEHCQLDLQRQHILLGTFGKALGGAGAFVVGDSDVIDHVMQFAKSYTYTTAMPPAVAAANAMSVSLIEAEPQWRTQLQENINYFQQCARQIDLPLLPSISPVQIIVLGNAARGLQIQQALWQQGFWVAMIRPPTVPEGTTRLRISLSALHQRTDIDRLLLTISQLLTSTVETA